MPNATDPTGMAPNPMTLDGTIGAFLLGTFVSLILYGVMGLQMYRYSQLYPMDNPSIKALVIAVMVLETVHTALPMHACYHYLVTNYFNIGAVTHGVWSINITSGIAAVITLFSQAFFARRVSLIGPVYKIVAIIALLLLLASDALSIVLVVQAFDLNIIATFVDQTDALTSSALALASGADYLLSGAIIFALRQTRAGRARPGHTIFDVLTIYILHSGLLTGVVHGITAATAIAWPHKLIWAAMGLVAARMYAITLFAVLNSRKLLVSRGVSIFDTNSPGRHLFARAHQLAEVEQWNVPRVSHLRCARCSRPSSVDMLRRFATMRLRSSM
ncbi:hypothetical protein BD413DRAFT_211553 [Trametes elegans]|nr:hypothetical protein BD413DRAFT_211553 [Trametes elegans]